MKLLDKYLNKKIKELDEHPELNKKGKISQKQTEKYIKFFGAFLLFVIFIILMICTYLYGPVLIFPPLV